MAFDRENPLNMVKYVIEIDQVKSVENMWMASFHLRQLELTVLTGQFGLIYWQVIYTKVSK